MTTRITMILAHDSASGMGVPGGMPWPRIAEDMRRFKAHTLGHPVIMGHETYLTFNGRPLPGRHNIVMSRKPRHLSDGFSLASCVDQALDIAGRSNEVMIIGGAQIYQLFAARAQRVLLTKVSGTFPATVFYRPGPEFEEVSSEQWFEKENLICWFKELVRT